VSTAATFERLNFRQREAAQAGREPLLVIAGAGTGKTNTLAHRVAHLILEGIAPERILLLTFTRRAALEMTRRAHAERYIQPSLEMLREIQRTGDIFFPLDWTSAVLGGHNSPAAAETVIAFLASQKDYPSRLRQVIEQTADPLLRAARLGGS